MAENIIYAAYYIFMGISCSFFMSKVSKQGALGFVISALYWPIMLPLAFIGVAVIDIILPERKRT